MTSKSKKSFKAIKLEEQDQIFISKTTKNERGVF